MTYDECLEKRVITEHLNSLSVKVNKVDYTISIDDSFNRLIVKDLVRYKEGNTTRKGCICKCSCGNYIGPSRLNMLITGELQSCGCYQNELHSNMLIKHNYKHGDSVRNKRSKLYVIWSAMKDRASNVNRPDAKYYANKGITVCDEWLSYEVFKDWALNNGYEDGLSIDRKDNSLGYCPSNCRWIPLSEQNSNKTSNVYLTYNGERKTLAEWSRITGLSWDILHRRIVKGLSVEEILGFND